MNMCEIYLWIIKPMAKNKKGYKSHNFRPFQELKALGEDLKRSDLVMFALYRTN
jgi:hypothetical protein